MLQYHIVLLHTNYIVSTLLWLPTAIITAAHPTKVILPNRTDNLDRNGILPHAKATHAMSEFGEHIQGMTTPYTQDSSGAQTRERNAVARIESGPRLPAHAHSTVATIDNDVAFRLGPGLLHALHDRHSDGRLATGDVPVVSTAQDPRPANVDENDNRKRKENDMYSDACGRSSPAQFLLAGAVALSRASP